MSDKSTLAPDVNPFDYSSTTYDGAAKHFYDQYRRLRIVDSFDFTSVFDLDLGEEPSQKGAKNCSHIGQSTPMPGGGERFDGYRYVNSKQPKIVPAYASMAVLRNFLKDHFVEPTEKSTDIRVWWKTAAESSTDFWRARLQRMVVECFDDGALARTQGVFGTNPLAIYLGLCNGLLNKTHVEGSGGPHHFDALLSIVNIACKNSMLSPTEMETLFGPAVVGLPQPRRLAAYTRNIGLMCSGMAGNFARYCTKFDPWKGAPRAGRTAKSIKVIATTNAERLGTTPIPMRWNLAGMEGAGFFGGSVPDIPALNRTSIGKIKPGDYIIHQGGEFNHVAIVNSIVSSGDKTGVLSTIESCGDDLSNGMTFRAAVDIEKTDENKGFRYKRLGWVPVEVRRINHFPWSDVRNDLSDIGLYAAKKPDEIKKVGE